MCDSVVATAPHTARGRTLFAKNSDRKAGECQPLLQFPAAHHAADAAGAEVLCTHISIPQVEKTFRVLGHSPWWVWGFEHGVNEFGLAIGNQAVFSRQPVEEEPGLIGMDLVRLGLERARNGREAVEVVSSLLEAHGQGGAGFAPDAAGYHNSFMIADPETAWVLETSGRHWAAREVELTSLSNHICLGSQWDASSSEITRFARDEGWWTGEGALDFEAAYRNPHVPPQLSSGRLRRSRELLERGRGSLSRCEMEGILRDHGEGLAAPPADATSEEERFFTLCVHADPPGPTTASMIAELPRDSVFAWPVWVSFAVPCSGIFLPVYLEGVIPASLARDEERHGMRSAWRVFSRLEAAAAQDLSRSLPRLREAWKPMEAKLEADRRAAEEEAELLATSSDRDGAAEVLSGFMQRSVEDVLDRAAKLTEELG